MIVLSLNAIINNHDEDDIENSSNTNEFVDATQMGIGSEKNDSSDYEDEVQEIVQKDINFLKDSWANLEEMEPTDDLLDDNAQQTDAGNPSSPNRNLYGKLPAQQAMSKQADNSVPEVDEHGFQMVTSKKTKKAEKRAALLKSSKSKPYITRSKVGAPKPFR